jgi:preprotein translocase subunit SecF
MLNGSMASSGTMKNILPTLAATESMSTLKTIAQDVINRTSDMSIQQQPQQQLLQPQSQQHQQQQQQQQKLQQQQHIASESRQVFFVENNNTNGSNTGSSLMNSLKTVETNEAHIPPLLGVAPLGPSPLQKEHQIQVNIVLIIYIIYVQNIFYFSFK